MNTNHLIDDIPSEDTFNNIQVIKDNKTIFQGKSYNEAIQNFITYSKNFNTSLIITYNQQKQKYYLLDKQDFRAGSWTDSFSKSNDKNDFWCLLSLFFTEIKYEFIHDNLIIYVE